MQRAAVTALTEGEPFVASQIARARAGRALVLDAFAAAGRFRFAPPAGAFYLFFAVDGFEDTRALALRLIDEIGVGLAPGNAFGDAGRGFMRLCFARDPALVGEAVRRLVGWVAKQ
jgi:aspartate/methionine/tyrosine aminotransferase